MTRKTAVGMLILLMMTGLGSPAVAELATDRRDLFLASFEAGESAFGQRNYPEAVRCFQAALSVQPDQVRPRYRLGQALQALGRNEECVAQFNTLLGRHPNHIAARVSLAQGLIGMGRVEDARPQLQWILQVQPEHAEARQLLARCSQPPAAPPAPGFQPLAGPAATRRSIAPAPGPEDPAPPTISAESPEELPNGFQPLPMRAGVVEDDPPAAPSGKGSPKAPRPATRPVPPPARNSETWKVTDFLEQTKGSFGVALEYAKFCIEKGDLEKATANLDLAEELALKKRDTRRFLESQIHRCLLNLYRSDIREFGQQILKIKPLLSRETYNSFLDIYNRAHNASSPSDVARLVGGVALGAEHYAVASAIFGEVLKNSPEDLFVARLLAEAQLGQRDFAGAEQTFIQIYRTHAKSAEAAMNLVKFYLTARFDPGAAARYLAVAQKLDPADQRIPVMRTLIDCVQGRAKEGLAELRKGLGEVRDPQVQILARRILEEGEAARKAGARIDYRALLALPGSGGSSPDELKMIGEESLKRSSFFTALKCFHEAHDLAEIGRSYLALSSQLFSSGDEETSALAAGFGLRALKEELKKNPASSRADLYLALYHFERRDTGAARGYVEAGLRGQAEPETRRHLRLLYGKVKG